MQTATGYEPGHVSLTLYTRPCRASVTLGCQIRAAVAQSRAPKDGLGSLICGRLLAKVWTVIGSAALDGGSRAWGSSSYELATWSEGSAPFFFSSKAKTADLHIQRAYTTTLVLLRVFGERNSRNFLRRSNFQAVEDRPV